MFCSLHMLIAALSFVLQSSAVVDVVPEPSTCAQLVSSRENFKEYFDPDLLFPVSKIAQNSSSDWIQYVRTDSVRLLDTAPLTLFPQLICIYISLRWAGVKGQG